MKLRLLFVLGAIVFGAAALQLYAQDKEKANPPGQDEMMKLWQESMTPNDHHKKLEAFAGKFNVESKFWMDGPDKPPTVTKGTAELTMELGGRTLCQKLNGEIFGMPMNGIGYNGYDNVKKLYWMFWIDNTATAMYTAEGNFDESGNVLTTIGKSADIFAPGKEKTVKYVCKIIDGDTWVFEMLETANGEEFMKTGEMTYTRKK